MNISEITVEDRLRVDMGDIDELCNSIREFGIIQPIVLARQGNKLVAGGRRFAALQRLGTNELEHGKHFIWNYETDGLRLKAIELEENIRRKDLSWQEIVNGKAQLLKTMQLLHGAPSGGRPRVGTEGGFGVAKLAAMLGESLGAVSQDLQVAEAITQFPALARAETKGNALTQLKILGAVASMTVSNKANPVKKDQRSWTLYECDFRVQQTKTTADSDVNVLIRIPDESVDLIWTDLPYGSDVGDMSGHKATSQLASFDDDKLNALSLLEDVAKESYRVLKQDRFAVFCFGFVTYNDLVLELQRAGFSVNVVPFIWTKNTKSGENPTTRYCNNYEPLIVAAKGSPVFIRPGQGNVVNIPVEQSKFQAVQKPIALVERFLLDMCTTGATIVDFCAGTGTTGVAAHKLGMKSILFEKDQSMAFVARTRLEAL
jgi:DNA modification methylase